MSHGAKAGNETRRSQPDNVDIGQEASSGSARYCRPRRVEERHGPARTDTGSCSPSLRAAQAGRPHVHRLAGRLHKLRRQVAPAVWQKLVPLAQQHRVAEYLIQDPFTRWSVEKPRGYSGDAGLLDIYYKHPIAAEIVASSTLLGRQIYAYTSEAASSAAGRERREFSPGRWTRRPAGSGNAEVLAIACGHLREAERLRRVGSSANCSAGSAWTRTPSASPR